MGCVWCIMVTERGIMVTKQAIIKQKDIINGAYTVYEDGRVWSSKTKRFMTHTRTGLNGMYMYVGMSKNGKPAAKAVHRLLAECFIPNPEGKLEINHKDGNSLNNDLNNLEWCTRSENMKHAYSTGLMAGKYKTNKCKGRRRKDI